VSNASGATVGSLSNANGATIKGGSGGVGVTGGVGGAGVSNAGAITILTNGGTISGGSGGVGRGATTFGAAYAGGVGGAGGSNAGTIMTLTNSGAISGGNGGAGGAGISHSPGAPGGAGGAGIMNSGMIATLTNTGTISGGNGGAGGSVASAGGAGIWNLGAIGSLANGGTIEGGVGGATGDAIYSAGKHASIGPITNSGQIIGNVVIDNQANVTVKGGTGNTLGMWTGGTITIGAGNLTFAGGNTALGDNIVVNGGKGTVFNDDPLMIAAPQTITGNFDQSATGLLDFGLAGDMPGQYGALAISGSASLDGGLGIDLTGGFTLEKGDSFDILGFASLTGGFTGLSLDGAVCTARPRDSWTCAGGVRLKEDIFATSLDLVVAHGDPAGSAAPEPSTWAMLALGFLGLGGLGLRKRARVA